jgi:hypothetical protein
MPTNLVQRCTKANGQGADFPTVWHTVLKTDPLVKGIPRQRTVGARSLLEIPLVTGQSLLYDGDRRQFSLESV